MGGSGVSVAVGGGVSDGSGARVAVVIGDDEAQANEVSVKPMQGGEQVRVGVNQLIATINNIIK